MDRASVKGLSAKVIKWRRFFPEALLQNGVCTAIFDKNEAVRSDARISPLALWPLIS